MTKLFVHAWNSAASFSNDTKEAQSTLNVPCISDVTPFYMVLQSAGF
jgi:hypothetical protein